MPVTNVHKDLNALTMTITAEFDASAERVWRTWADPRLLERWWGPPTFPATFVEHDLSAGGRSTYFMTGPDGKRHHGWWRMEAVEPHERLRFQDGFADEAGNHDEELPTQTATVTFAESDGVTTMTVVSEFADRKDMERMMEMGMEQGMTEALGQIDSLL